MTRPWASLLLALGLSGCPTHAPHPTSQRTPPPPTPAELSEVQQLRAAEVAWLSDRPKQAQEALAPILRVVPDHLEARVLLALALSRSKAAVESGAAWLRVERIIVVKGKIAPFLLQTTLLGAAEHYLEQQRRLRSELFLEELWRRFPVSDAAARAQLLVAEHAYRGRRWQRLIEACATLRRIQPRHAANGRCGQLALIARRLSAVGPPAPATGPRWLWESPLPQGNDLNAIWVGPKGEQVLVGAAGTIIERSTRGAYQVVPSLTRWALRGVAGNSPTSLYAVGDGGVVLARDARGWRVLRATAPAQADLLAVWSSGPGRMVAVGDGGEVLWLKDGVLRREQPTKVALHGVWGSSDRDVFAVGGEGTLLRYDGARWQRFSSDAYENLRGIWGASPTHVLVAGDRRTIVYFDGRRAKESIQGLADFRSVWGSGTRSAWAVGKAGAIIRGGRVPLAEWASESSGTMVELRGVAGRNAREIFAVGEGGTVLARSARGWRTLAGGSTSMLVSTFVTTSGEAFVLGLHGKLLLRKPGKEGKVGKWQGTHLPIGGLYRALYAEGGQLTMVGHRGLLVRGDGKSYRRLDTGTPEDLHAVHGCRGQLFAAGARGTLLRVVGEQVAREAVPTGQRLRALAGCRRLWAAGDRGTILQRVAGTWRRSATDEVADLHALWVDARERVAIAVGTGGTILRWQGRRWRRMQTPLSQTLVSVWGRAADDVYAVSAGGNALHFDGKAWHLERSPAACLRALHGRDKDLLAVGCHGAILRRVE